MSPTQVESPNIPSFTSRKGNDQRLVHQLKNPQKQFPVIFNMLAISANIPSHSELECPVRNESKTMPTHRIIRMATLLVSLAFFPMTAALSAEDSETIQLKLAKAKAEFGQAKKIAEEKLIASIDAEIEAVGKSALKAETRLKIIMNMEKEKERFEKSKWIPLTERLQKASAVYVKDLVQAERGLHIAYEKYLSILIGAKDIDGAKKVIEARKKEFPRINFVKIEWDNDSSWEFWIDECAGTWKDRWKFEKGKLVIITPPANEKGKPTVETILTVSDDGTTFTMPLPDRTISGKRVPYTR